MFRAISSIFLRSLSDGATAPQTPRKAPPARGRRRCFLGESRGAVAPLERECKNMLETARTCSNLLEA
eukprot:6129448-Alexandrium_andersonii.AAC.1